MNIYEIIIIAVIVLLVVNAIIYLIRGRKRGKNGCSCERSCEGCAGCSPSVVAIEDESKDD